MMGYVPQILPQAYIETRSLRGLGNYGYSAPPLVSANAAAQPSTGGGWLSLVTGLIGGAMQGGTQSSYEFNAAAAQIQAQRLANERSRRWGAFGALALGVAGLAGVVYLLRK